VWEKEAFQKLLKTSDTTDGSCRLSYCHSFAALAEEDERRKASDPAERRMDGPSSSLEVWRIANRDGLAQKLVHRSDRRVCS
jgi:hypothetical protein